MSLERALAALFPEEVRVAAAAARDLEAELYAEEQAQVARAVAARRQEYATGRVLARRVLCELGFEAAPLLAGADRAPRWPQGAIGSIAHAGGMCAVAVARAGTLRSLGLDLEPATPLEPELWDTVCTSAERAWLAGRPTEERGLLAKLFFSAKECAYKCQYPLSGAVLDFADVELELDSIRQTFTARLPTAAGRLAGAAAVCGRYARAAGQLVTAAALASRG